MFWLKGRAMDILGVIALIGVISYGFYDNWKSSFSSWEFWILGFILIIQIKHIIPEKWKSYWYYIYNKKIIWLYFNFNLSYSFDFNNESKTSNEIFLIIEDLLRGENKVFRKVDTNLFIFWEYLNIKYTYDEDLNKQWLVINLKNDKYTIDSLEKDLSYYKKIFWILKDNLWWAINQSISSNIKINKFYSPEYLLKKYSKWYNQLEVKIEESIMLKRKINEEELIIKSSSNLDDITNKLKNYIKLTL